MRKALLWLLLVSAPLAAAVPTPREHFGFTPGDDYKLADFEQISSYFGKLAGASDRLLWREFGRSSHGKPMYVAFISSAENLRRLEEHRQTSRRLALGQATAEEARRMSREGRAIVWIDSGLHSSEVAPAQHAPEFAYRMLTGETEEIQRIRDKVIIMQIPVINPDGHDWIVEWYRGNVGTPYEIAPLPRLYQKYAGHDNNRDWFMLNLQETRHVTKLLFQDWFPQIVYNQHQVPPFPARIFVPPYADPLNPHILPAVMEGIHVIGSAMKERFAREGKPGVLSYHGFDGWWNGGLRSVPAFHNMHGILTEVAGHAYATPREYKSSELPARFANGIPTKEPSIFYQLPWLGGRWTLRDAIDYMLTADFAILDLASSRPEHFLLKSHEMARANIETGMRGKPYAYVIPQDQWDRSSALDMLWRLAAAGIEVRRSRSAFSAGGKNYAAGSYVLLAGQPFRSYLLDLMEPQKYPEIRQGPTGPLRRPYDVAGWTMSMSMGVSVDRIDEPFQTELELLSEVPRPQPSRNRRENASFLATAELLEAGRRLRWSAQGDLLVEGEAPAAEFAAATWELARPRLALYEPWSANMDSGWTQYVLDTYKVPHTLLRNDDVRQDDLRKRFDAILLASQSTASILHGFRPGEQTGRTATPGAPLALQRPEYTGGIGVAGLHRLDQFVRDGGTLIALDAATELPIQFFGLPVRNVVRAGAEPGSAGFYCPGSLLRISVDTSHPLAAGMPTEAVAFSSGGHAFDVTLAPGFNTGERAVRSVARFAANNLLASGYVTGEREVLGKDVMLEARHGKGRVVLFGIRPQFRAQTQGTFKLLLNAVYSASARELKP